MENSFVLIEFTSIAKAYGTINYILLNHPVNIFFKKDLCPGRVLYILQGSSNDVIDIKSYLIENKIPTQSILNVSDEVINSLNKKNLSNLNSILVCEFNKSIYAIKSCDLCYKKSIVDIVEIKFNVGLFGKAILVLSSDVSNLKNSMSLIEENFKKNIIGLELIERPTKELIKCL